MHGEKRDRTSVCCKYLAQAIFFRGWIVRSLFTLYEHAFPIRVMLHYILLVCVLNTFPSALVKAKDNSICISDAERSRGLTVAYSAQINVDLGFDVRSKP